MGLDNELGSHYLVLASLELRDSLTASIKGLSPEMRSYYGTLAGFEFWDYLASVYLDKKGEILENNLFYIL